MRALIIAAGVSLAISACTKDNGAENGAAASNELTADDIVANDVTAIDAATNEAANMADDVDFTVNEDNESGDVVTPGATSPLRPRRTPQPPADNSAAPDSED